MKFIKPSRIRGIISAPPSKSFTQRAIAAAVLARGQSELIDPSFCDDSKAAIGVARSLGAKVTQKKSKILVTGGGAPQNKILECGESGLCIRTFAPIAALFPGQFTLTGKGSLLTRPVYMMEQTLKSLGADCITNEGVPPVEIRGPIRGGKLLIDGALTSQFLTGLLMALPLCNQDSEIRVSNLKSKPYIRMTLSLLKDFGVNIDYDDELENFKIPGGQKYKARKYRIEGDWSGGAFLLVAGAIAGKVRVNNLSPDSRQADKAIIEALRQAGAELKIGKNYAVVEKGGLRGFEFDVSDCPDLFPPLVALACNCEGKTVLTGTERLVYKESNRLFAAAYELSRIGAVMKVSREKVEIKGTKLKGGVLDSQGDHRIAMTCALAALNSEKGVRLEGWECVSKSYPGFFRDLKALSIGIE